MTRYFPPWIRKRLIYSDGASEVNGLISMLGLHTVCKSSCCPNMSECFSKKKVTFMILSNVCTRDCKFCAVKKGGPPRPDRDEPEKICRAVRVLGLKHVIITSVTRDDLEDGGAGQFSAVAFEIKKDRPDVTIEVLTPDFKGVESSLNKVLDSPINVFSHNIETVRRLYDIVRPQADYKRSLKILKKAKRKISKIKSSIMVGLGETKNEVFEAMRDLRDVGCDLLTIGQYLQPTKRQLEVYEFVYPETFVLYEEKALSMGFKRVLSGPFARTSYMS